jgi:hypothetical protein
MITRKQGSEPEPQQLYFFLIKAAGSSALPANRNQSRDAPCQHRRIPVWTQQIVSGPETTTYCRYSTWAHCNQLHGAPRRRPAGVDSSAFCGSMVLVWGSNGLPLVGERALASANRRHRRRCRVGGGRREGEADGGRAQHQHRHSLQDSERFSVASIDGGTPLEMSLKMDLDAGEIPVGPRSRAMFEQAFSEHVAAGLGVDSALVQVTGIIDDRDAAGTCSNGSGEQLQLPPLAWAMGEVGLSARSRRVLERAHTKLSGGAERAARVAASRSLAFSSARGPRERRWRALHPAVAASPEQQRLHHHTYRTSTPAAPRHDVRAGALGLGRFLVVPAAAGRSTRRGGVGATGGEGGAGSGGAGPAAVDSLAEAAASAALLANSHRGAGGPREHKHMRRRGRTLVATTTATTPRARRRRCDPRQQLGGRGATISGSCFCHGDWVRLRDPDRPLKYGAGALRSWRTGHTAPDSDGGGDGA